MNRIKLILPTGEYERQVIDYKNEHNEASDYKILGSGGLSETYNFQTWLETQMNSHQGKDLPENIVANTTFLAVSIENNKLIGMINIRHTLNDHLSKYGGHIGYGIRPCERGFGYATEMLELAIIEAHKLGIDDVIISCNKNNGPSNKVIQKNDGILFEEVFNPISKDIKNRYVFNKSKGTI